MKKLERDKKKWIKNTLEEYQTKEWKENNGTNKTTRKWLDKKVGRI